MCCSSCEAVKVAIGSSGRGQNTKSTDADVTSCPERVDRVSGGRHYWFKVSVENEQVTAWSPRPWRMQLEFDCDKCMGFGMQTSVDQYAAGYTIDTTEEKVGHPDAWSKQLIDIFGAALMTSVGGILVVSLMLIAVLYYGLSRRPAQVYTRVTGRLSRAEMGKARVWP